MTSDRPETTSAMALVLGVMPRGRLVLVALLMLLAALSEGLGLFLLVPVIGLAGGAPLPPVVAGALAALGLPLRLAPLLAAFVALVALRAAVLYHRGMAAQKLGFTMIDALRARCFRLLLGADWRVLSAMRQSDNASLLIGNIDRIDSAVRALFAATSAVVLLLGAGLTALAIAPMLALLMALGGALALTAYRALRRRAVALGEMLGQATDAVYARIDESLGALRLIKALMAERHAADRLAEGFGALRAAELAYSRSFALGQLVLQVSASAALALAVWLAIERIGVSATALVPLVALFARAVPLLGQLPESWQNWLHATPAIHAVQSLIDRLEAAAEPPLDPAVAAPRLERAITLRAVCVNHEGRETGALQDVAFEIPARTTLALTGPSGAGKSTLADLLCGLITPDSGTIAIDGQVLDGAQRRAWRGQVAYVQQDPVLFHASIRENLAWAAPEADEAAMRAALRAAAADFVEGLPQGLDTLVGDRGARLSGGERQRISLARALLVRPQLLVLDEATSALDPENEAAIGAAIARLAGQMTIIVICHRGALAAGAGTVVTLAQGRVVSTQKRIPLPESS